MSSSNHSFLPSINYKSYLDKMLLLGFHATKKGVCFGLTMMWIQAVLSNQSEKFDARMKLICSTRPLILTRRIKAVQEKVKMHSELTDEDRTYLDILAFFNGVALYQTPEAHTDLFGEKITQRQIEKISPLTASDEINKRQGLVQLPLSPKIYTQEELTNYFNDLAHMIKSFQDKLPKEDKIADSDSKVEVSPKPLNNLVVRLSDYNHSIALHFNGNTNKWLVCDPDLLPISEHSPEVIAQRLLAFFNTSPLLAFKPRLYTTGDCAAPPTEIKEFEEKHALTTEMKQRVTNESITLALIAARTRDEALATHLVNIADEKTGNTPLHHAVSSNMHEGDDIAAGIADILILAQYGGNFSQKNNAGDTPITLAIKNQKWYMLIAILLNIKDIKKIEPSDQRLLLTHTTSLQLALKEIINQKQISTSQLLTVAREENALGILLKPKASGLGRISAKTFSGTQVKPSFWKLIHPDDKKTQKLRPPAKKPSS